jgi:hypothetical protein
MLLKGTREVIIEDLNSTNGVLINGHKVMRHVLSDGDLITIGETQFQCRLRPNSRATEAPNEAATGGANAPSAGRAAVGPMAPMMPVAPVMPEAAAPAAPASEAAAGSDSGFSGPPGQAEPQAARQTDPPIGE